MRITNNNINQDNTYNIFGTLSNAFGSGTTASGDFSLSSGLNNEVNSGSTASSIIGGTGNTIYDSYRSTIIGGKDLILSGQDDTTFVDYLRINSTIEDNSTSKLLTIDNNGNVKYRNSSSFGSGSQSFFFYKILSSVVGSYYTQKPIIPPITSQTINANSVIDGQLLAAFISLSADTQSLFIPAGIGLVHIHATQTSGTKTTQLYAHIYKRDSGGTETLLATTSYSDVLDGIDGEYTTDFTISGNTILNNEYLVTKIYAYVTGGGSPPYINLYVEDYTTSRLEIPYSNISGVNGWLLTGNAGTDGGTNNFIGTTDDISLQFRVNNKKSGLISDSNYQLVSFGYETLVNSTATNNITGLGYQALKNSSGNNLISIGPGSLLGANLTNAIGIGTLSLNASSGDNVIGIGNSIMSIGNNNVLGFGNNVVFTSDNQIKFASNYTHLVMPLNGMVDGYVLTVVSGATRAVWRPAASGTTNYWTSGSTGTSSLKVINSSLIDATGDYALAEGYNTLARGLYSHAEGYGTVAFADATHAEGYNTRADGDYSHAGGYNTTSSGQASFVHGYNSKVLANWSVVLGKDITGTTNNTTYVDYFNIKRLAAGTAIYTLGIDSSGNVVSASTSSSSAFTGGTVSGATIFTGGLTANTISATTYQNLPIDIRITGGTYSAASSSLIFTNNTGGTFTVTGITTSSQFTGGTVSGSTNFTNTILSGGTNLNNIFATTATTNNLQAQINTINAQPNALYLFYNY